jgi:glucose uptake protein GlcU
MILGLVFAGIVSVLFAVYAVPRKFSQQNVILYTMWMSVAYFIGTVILISILWGLRIEEPENLLNLWHLLTVLRGFIWLLGMAAYNLAIDKIGLTRFNQWKNIQGPVGSLLILFVLADVVGIKILWLILAMIVMFASALMFQITTDVEQKNLIASTKNAKMGIALALFSGVCFGITALLNSIVTRPTIVGETFTYTQLLYHSVSLVIFSVIVYMVLGGKFNGRSTVKQRFKDIFKVDRKTWLPIITGGMFLIATLLTIYSYRLIPNAVAWSIMQLNVFWTVFIGLFIFKEINYKQHWLRLSLGVVMAVGACVLLFYAI